MQTDLFDLIDKEIEHLIEMISQFEKISYTQVCNESGASIGQHIRHAIEIFSLLVTQYDDGNINYELRSRDVRIEQDQQTAILLLRNIKANYKKADRSLKLHASGTMINTSYSRELLYQLEHIIHHNAIIKPMILKHSNTSLDDNFGYAHSTLKYKEETVKIES